VESRRAGAAAPLAETDLGTMSFWKTLRAGLDEISSWAKDKKADWEKSRQARREGVPDRPRAGGVRPPDPRERRAYRHKLRLRIMDPSG